MADALKQDVPEPPRTVDPDAIISRHRQRRQSRRTAAIVGSLAVAAIAAPTALLRADLGWQEASPASGATVQVSALEQTEPIPVEWSEGLGLPTEASRVATMSGDAAAYLWADGDLLCLAHLFGVSNGGVPGGGVPLAPEGCTAADALLTEGLVSVADGSGESSATDRHLVVIVPDGYTTVTLGTLTAPVTRNAAVFTWDYKANVADLSRSTDGLILQGDGQPTATIPVR